MSQAPAPNAPPTDFIKLEIQGRLYKLPLRYAAGHPLTEAEAVALNSMRATNMRGIFTKFVKDAAPGTDLDQAFAALAETYEFTRTVPKSAQDPVERIAYTIATDLANQLLRRQNITKHSLQEGEFEKIVLRILNEQPGLMEEAKQRAEAAERLAADLATRGV